MLTILHGADFHLDSPFSGLTPAQATARRREQRALLDRLAELARDEGAELVLLSGDLLDSRLIFRETAQALAGALSRIPCPVFIAPGNHDYYSARSPYATLDWPEQVHIFSPGQMQSVELPALCCTVYGRAFSAPHEEDGPLTGFHATRREGWLNLMCLHGDVAPTSQYGPITPAEIAASGLDYLALGHIHQCSGLQRDGGSFWAYPGCPEGRGFDETGEKGVLCLQAEPGSVSVRFVPLGRRRYERLPVDLTETTDPLSAILTALPGDTRRDIYRILLTGQSPAPDLRALELALADKFYALSLEDATRLPQNLWARREEDTLTGLFLQAMWDRYQQQPDDQIIQMAARFGLAALENGEVAD